MRRRALMSLLGGAAVAWPLAARAQQPSVPVIGFLHSASLGPHASFVAAFQQGLRAAGYVEGQNVAIEYRWAEGQFDRLPTLVTEFVRRQVSIIVAPGSPSALAAKTATTTIPIVFFSGVDPVKLGLVASLNRPAGNITGVSLLNSLLVAKRLELLHELVPTAGAIALLVNPTTPFTEAEIGEAQVAARTLGLQLHFLNASGEAEIDTAFADMVQMRIGALVVSADGFFISQRKRIIRLAESHAVPAIYQLREFAEAGGLMSYGTDLAEAYRQMGIYSGRILKGDKPGDLPVQQATKFELVLNLKTAKALGLTFPLPLLGRADEVIE
jgi:putative tryptophan/tyrosine transport system substrate-binding protein